MLRTQRPSAALIAPSGRLFFRLFTAFAILSSAPAYATFSGANGAILYEARDTRLTQQQPSRGAIFSTVTGQLTFPDLLTATDYAPAFSRDGKQILFIRWLSSSNEPLNKSLIQTMSPDGSNVRTLMTYTPLNMSGRITSAAWSADGQRIAFNVNNGLAADTGIWIVNTDGTGLRQVVPNESRDEQTTFEPEWSPLEQSKIAFRCRYRLRQPTVTGQSLRDDLCVVDVTTDTIRRIDINWNGGQIVSRPHWTPAGDRLIFTLVYPHLQNITFTTPNGSVSGNVVSYQRAEIFTIRKDGTGITELTQSPYVVTNSSPFVVAKTTFGEAEVSPDGERIVARGSRLDSSGASTPGIWLLDKHGRQSSLLLNAAKHGGFVTNLAWQPIPHALTLEIHDGITDLAGGGPHPLKGLKLEIRTAEGAVVNDRPLNTAGGTYVFEAVPPAGDYVVRATLVDAFQPPAASSFEIRYSHTATAAAWMEWRLTISGPAVYKRCFCENDPDLIAHTPDIPSEHRDRLDDLANLYFRVRQYVDWVKMRLMPGTGLTVAFYTFATVDPVEPGRVVQTDRAYYRLDTHIVVMGIVESEYKNRDGLLQLPEDGNGTAVKDGGPENSEWHEFTHHLYRTFVNETTCTGINHAGYDNPDTCDSMDEGFAEFLPTLAAQEIEGAEDAEYATTFIDLDKVKYKPWGYRADTDNVTTLVVTTEEEFAVAGLFWDLIDATSDSEDTQVIGGDRSHRVVTYRDRTTIPLTQLWEQLISSSPATVRDLRAMFGQPLSVDLDGDGLMDVATIDQVFLMHGFFPVDDDQSITSSHFTYHYDVGYAQRRINPSGPRNGAVGYTNHRRFNAAGQETAVLIPRANTPAEARANVKLEIVDETGTAVSGAIHTLTVTSAGNGTGTTSGSGRYGGLKVDATIQYPGGRTALTTRMLASGDQALLPMDLPPYFNYLLPDGAALPDCDPAHDFIVQVAISATANGFTSPTTQPFDNCTYQRAMASATSAAALSYSVTLPGSATPVAAVSAVADPGSVFSGWSGPDAEECAVGSVIMTADKSCIATFIPVPYTLTLNTVGTGSGAVTGAGSYASGETATVSAAPNSGSTFDGWSGPDAAECTIGSVLMTADKNCTATFTLITHTLTLSTAGVGTGTVIGGGTYGQDQTVIVSATPDPGSAFGGWSGPNGSECATGTVLMNTDKSCVATFVNDTTPPNGTIVINNNAIATTTRAVTLTLSCNDPAGCSQMQFSNTGGTNGWSKLQPFATSAAWSMTNGDGQKTVYVRFLDGVANLSSVVSDQILLDTANPAGTIAINGNAPYTNATSVVLTLTCSDSVSGCNQMQFSNDGTTWSAFEPFATSKVWALPAGDGAKTVSARYQDLAGNLSTVKTDQIALDTVVPTASVVINGGTAYAKSTAVTLTLSCMDAGGSNCSQMQFSNDNSLWSPLQNYAASAAWTLAAGDGIKTVSARFFDAAGNLSSSYTAQITLDSTIPTGTIAINDDAASTATRSVTLTLSCTDGGSGCSQMQFSDNGTSGWSKVQPFSLNATYTLPNGIGTKTVYVRFTDGAGNVSANASDSIVLQ